MAILLYNNGVIEEFKCENLTFTDSEIIEIFDDFELIKSIRFLQLADTWCVWGENKKQKEQEYNRLATGVLGINIFSPLLFLHDTEIDPQWNLTNTPILKNYDKFKFELYQIFDKMAEEILNESNENNKEYNENTKIFLIPIGPTEDRRMLFEFNPHLQPESFYQPLFFNKFADRVFGYIKTHYKKNPFLVYADNKIMMMITNDNVECLLNQLTSSFEKKEQYEICSEIKKVKEYWMNKLNSPQRKSRTKKNKEAEK
jgi:hypothetical protein